MQISLETLKTYQMYLQKKKLDHKTDFNKTATENLAELVLISITLDEVTHVIDQYDDCY